MVDPIPQQTAPSVRDRLQDAETVARERLREAVMALRDAGDVTDTTVARLEQVSRALGRARGGERGSVAMGAVRELGAVLRVLREEGATHPIVSPVAAALMALAPLCGNASEPGAPHPRAGDERRATRRVPIRAEVGFDSETHFYKGFSEDLSQGGIFVATYHPLPVGARVAISFVLPDGHAVEAEGRVEWVRDPPDRSTSPGLGIRFDALSSEDERAIHGFLQEREPFFYDV